MVRWRQWVEGVMMGLMGIEGWKLRERTGFNGRHGGYVV